MTINIRKIYSNITTKMYINTLTIDIHTDIATCHKEVLFPEKKQHCQCFHLTSRYKLHPLPTTLACVVKIK